MQDLHDPNRRLKAGRTRFAGAAPGLLLALFTQPALTHPTPAGRLGVYGRVLPFVAAGMEFVTAAEALGLPTLRHADNGGQALCVAHHGARTYWKAAP